MELTTSYDVLYDRLDAAHRAAAGDTLGDIVRKQARITGELANSFQVFEIPQGAGPRRLRRIYIASTSVYADAVERGAWTRERASVRKGTKRSRSKKRGDMHGPLLNRASSKGPHMKGNHVVLENGQNFLAHMGYRLRTMP